MHENDFSLSIEKSSGGLLLLKITHIALESQTHNPLLGAFSCHILDERRFETSTLVDRNFQLCTLLSTTKTTKRRFNSLAVACNCQRPGRDLS